MCRNLLINAPQGMMSLYTQAFCDQAREKKLVETQYSAWMVAEPCDFNSCHHMNPRIHIVAMASLQEANVRLEDLKVRVEASYGQVLAKIAEQEKTQGLMIEKIRRLIEEGRSKGGTLKDLYKKKDSRISAIHTKLIALEPRPSSGGKDERWHLARPKDFVPSVLNGKDEEWVR